MKTLPPALGASESGGDHTARAENERSNLVGIPNFSGSQACDRDEHHLLRQIVSGHVVAKVPQAEQANAPSKSAIQLAFGRSRVTSRGRRHFTRKVAVEPSRERRGV